MPESTAKAMETACDGGFRIETSQDELTATRTPSAWKKRTSSIASRVFVAIVAVVLAINLLFSTVPLLIDRPLGILLVAAFIFVPGVLWARLRGTNNLHCTRQNLEVIRLIRGRETGRWLFPCALVKQIRYAAVSYSKYGSTFALVFTVEGKKVKVLRGIECPEAQIILRELHRLGFDVVQDIGMPMMVEMALERRDKLKS
jgi:phosphoribosylformylglycinamidine (FGAM) synthase PurS component